MADTWDPGQYERFEAERRQPFDDLLALVAPCPGGRVVDLGCGTGALTAELHGHTGAAQTLGIDRSASMLARAPEAAGLRFEEGDLATPEGGPWDLVFANAALQWVPDHPRLLQRLVAMVTPGGQLAFQVPANSDHPAYRLAHALAAEQPFLDAFAGSPPPDRGATVLAPEAYATLLDGLGAAELHARLQVYGHHLGSPLDVVEWVKGTLLTPFEAALDEVTYARFLSRYRERWLIEAGGEGAYFFTFKRILVRARWR